MKTRRLLFWGGVAGVSLLAPFMVALVANKYKWPGLQTFRAFTYGTTTGSGT